MAHSVFMFELFPPSILLVSDPAYFPVKRRAGENQRGRQSHRTRWHALPAEHQGEDKGLDSRPFLGIAGSMMGGIAPPPQKILVKALVEVNRTGKW